MKSVSLKSIAVRSAVAIAAVVACAGASAVTVNPSAIPGVTAASFQADTLGVADFAKVTFDPVTGSFSEAGYLAVGYFLNAGSFSAPSGYGMYISFTAKGSSGLVTSVSYDLYGYKGAASFDATAAGATTTAVGATLLGSGSLSTPDAGDNYTAAPGLTSADVHLDDLTFTSMSSIFSPVGSINAQFSNIGVGTQLFPTADGFYVKGGGGSVNLFAAPVPEPETYALMLGGLAAVGFLARRRNNG